MFGKLLWIMYIASIICCYGELDSLINRALKLLMERHPSLPIDDVPTWKGLKLTLELLLVSSIPGINIVAGCFFATMSDSVLDEIVSKVELEHYEEIRKWECKPEND